jgi:hypothetical protein
LDIATVAALNQRLGRGDAVEVKRLLQRAEPLLLLLLFVEKR